MSSIKMLWKLQVLVLWWAEGALLSEGLKGRGDLEDGEEKKLRELNEPNHGEGTREIICGTIN